MRNVFTYASVLVILGGGACVDYARAEAPLFGHAYEVSASSVLTDGKSYTASNIIPPSLSRAWCEGVKGEGVGEWLEMRLKEPALGEIDLAILPGYAKNDKAYASNGRPKNVALVINDHISQEVEIKDVSREQLFRLSVPSGEKVAKIRVTVLSVYSGSKFDDTCITEVVLLPVKTLSEKDGDIQTEKEVARVPVLLANARSGGLDAIEELVRMADGSYIKTAEGGEFLYEIYLDLFADNPYRLLFVALRQNDEIASKALDAIINPVFDKYTSTQLLGLLDKAVRQGIDPGAVEAVRAGLIQRKKALND